VIIKSLQISNLLAWKSPHYSSKESEKATKDGLDSNSQKDDMIDSNNELGIENPVTSDNPIVTQDPANAEPVLEDDSIDNVQLMEQVDNLMDENLDLANAEPVLEEDSIDDIHIMEVDNLMDENLNDNLRNQYLIDIEMEMNKDPVITNAVTAVDTEETDIGVNNKAEDDRKVDSSTSSGTTSMHFILSIILTWL
jgi:hypothetical protein